MSREWKPGDVAMTARHTIALCHQSGRMIDQDGAPWSDERFSENLRPLVVIDPEDREQVDRLTEALFVCGLTLDGSQINPTYVGDEFRAGMYDRVQAALREFANPKPEEPTGLGAVVEDSAGRRFFRHNTDIRWPWRLDTLELVEIQGYDTIDAVRVLSEGVTNE